MKARITQIGNSTGLILPKEIADRLKVQKGDEVFLTETKNGFTATPYDPEFEEQIAAASKGMGKYRNALRALAK